MRMNKKGQNIAEYSIIIGVVSSALLLMGVYFQRGIQSVIKEPIDNLGGFGSTLPSGALQFSPQRIQEMGMEDNIDWSKKPAEYLTPLDSTVSVASTKTITTSVGGERKTDINENITSNRTQRSFQEIKYDQISQHQ